MTKRSHLHLALSAALMSSAAAQAKPAKKQPTADEQLIEAIQGTWVASPDPTNGAIAAWLWTDIQGGTNSGSNIIDVLDIKIGQEVRLTFTGSRYTLTQVGDNDTTCWVSGEFSARARHAREDYVGELDFSASASDCKPSHTATIHQLGNDTRAISCVMGEPGFGLGRLVSVSDKSNELFVELPLDLNTTDTDHDTQCQTGVCQFIWKFSRAEK